MRSFLRNAGLALAAFVAPAHLAARDVVLKKLAAIQLTNASRLCRENVMNSFIKDMLFLWRCRTGCMH